MAIIRLWELTFLVTYISTISDGELFITVSVHGINLVLLLIDFTLHKIPIRILHSVYTFILGVVYVVMSLIYTNTTNKPIYRILDWCHTPNTAALCVVGTFVAIFVVQVVLFGLHRLKIHCCK